MSLKRIFTPLAVTGLAVGLSSPVMAEPPSWAPAHGYHKNKGKHKKDKHYDDDGWYSANADHQTSGGFAALSCDHTGATTGAVVGGIIGGVLGSQIGKGDGKTLATIAGTILGAYVGEAVGADMDTGDEHCAGESFEVAQNNQSVGWVNPDTRAEYTVTPVSNYNNRAGQTCRDYTSEVNIDGRRQTSTGTACKDSGGNWRIIN